MRKRTLITWLQFTAVWLLFHWYAGSFNHLSDAPRGVHQGAQCDRASIALNYYHNDLNFLYPEVHENRCKDGIVSCELPLSNYLAAVLYTTFGFNEKWFRLITFLFVSIGMFALFGLFRLYVKPITAYVLVFLLNASPILLFYTTNFLPDATALGLVLAAWYLFFKQAVPHAYEPAFKSNKTAVLFAIILGLAIATKTTCGIQWMCMAGVLLLSFIKGLKIELLHKKRMAFSLLGALAIPAVWQLWARHLGNLHNSEFFMMHVPLLNTLAEVKDAWQVYLGNWPSETFARPLHYFAISLLLLPLFLFKYIPKQLWWLNLLNTLGTLAFMALMIKQFMYHDYYILCLLPLVVLNWLAIASALTQLASKFWWVKVAAFIALLWALKIQVHYGRQNMADRYTAGNYWEQSQQNIKQYARFKQQLRSKGINRTQCVLVGYDGAPNNVLYLLDLQGRRINSDFSDEQVKDAIYKIQARYVISTDSSFTARVRPLYKEMTEVAAEGELKAFKVADVSTR